MTVSEESLVGVACMQAWMFVPQQNLEEVIFDIMGNDNKAREVLAKLAEIKKKQKS